jgi:hypothetical protein
MREQENAMSEQDLIRFACGSTETFNVDGWLRLRGYLQAGEQSFLAIFS